jgi:hypothetical protein
MPSWVGIVRSTIADYLREAEPAALRNRVFFGMLEKLGRIKYNCSGDYVDWPIKKKRATMSPYEDFMTMQFGRMNRLERPILDWRGYTATEALSEMDKLKNRGPQAIVKIFSEMTETLMEDCEEFIHGEVYTDGNASGNENKWHGLESIFGTTGSVLTGNSRVFNPSDTYANISTSLGTFGGSWSYAPSTTNVEWPNGAGDISYEAWSPLVIDIRSTAYGTGATTWKGNCMAAMSYACTSGYRNAGDDKNKVFLLDREWLGELKDELRLKEKIEVTSTDTPLHSLGFQRLRFDGYDVTTEYGLPRSSSANDTKVGYFLDFSKIEFMCMYPKMFEVKGPEWDVQRQAYLLLINSFGNMRFKSPRYQTKLMAS